MPEAFFTIVALAIIIGLLLVVPRIIGGAPYVREEPDRALLASRPATLVRVYKGKQQADAASLMETDAAELGKLGYSPASQSWAPGQWGCGAFLVALVLFVVLIGILVFLYMLFVKPDGTLTVTYVLRDAAPSADVAGTLAQLASLRDAGVITPEEYDAKRADVLARL